MYNNNNLYFVSHAHIHTSATISYIPSDRIVSHINLNNPGYSSVSQVNDMKPSHETTWEECIWIWCWNMEKRKIITHAESGARKVFSEPPPSTETVHHGNTTPSWMYAIGYTLWNWHIHIQPAMHAKEQLDREQHAGYYFDGYKERPINLM